MAGAPGVLFAGEREDVADGLVEAALEQLGEAGFAGGGVDVDGGLVALAGVVVGVFEDGADEPGVEAQVRDDGAKQGFAVGGGVAVVVCVRRRAVWGLARRGHRRPARSSARLQRGSGSPGYHLPWPVCSQPPGAKVGQSSRMRA